MTGSQLIQCAAYACSYGVFVWAVEMIYLSQKKKRSKNISSGSVSCNQRRHSYSMELSQVLESKGLSLGEPSHFYILDV